MRNGWLFILFILATGLTARQLTVRRSGGDSGGFWAQVIDRLSLYLGIPLLIISSFHTLPFLKSWLPLGQVSWLVVVGIGWLTILSLGILKPPAPDSGRWISGILEFSPHRFWVLLFLAPFIPALFFTTPPWLENIYAAHWAFLVAFFAALIGLAVSASPMSTWAGATRTAQTQNVALSPWPDEMQSRGISLRTIAEWEASAPPEPAIGVTAEWQQRLAEVGSQGVSSVLCRAISKLITAMPGREDRVAIVLGPDECGQEEVVALAATELSRRYGEATLVISASSDPALANRLRFWLDKIGGETPAEFLDLTADTNSSAPLQPDLFVTDAETLSDSVLDQLRGELESYASTGPQGLGLSRIGLVVWWNAHEFSGVLAAHVWAVSRRLERLLKTRRGTPPRATVFARRPEEREAAFLGFLAHLLPYEQTKDNQFQIAPAFSRKTNLYRLQDASPTAARKATQASLLTDWETFPSPSFYSTSEPRPAAQSAAAAGARIMEIRPDEVLSLREMICQGGRASLPGIDQHVAVAASDNPYVDFLVSRYGQQSESSASINLIGAEGQPELVRRHLLLGLREVPDTLTGLRADFRWEETMLRQTLERLSRDGRLRRFPVRFLDESGRLQRDSRYANQNPGQGAVRSFRMIGRSQQVELRDPNVRNRLLLQLDVERLPIEAYPQRVFESLGRRYRVQGWPSAEPTRVDCLPEENDIRTWPFSTFRIGAVRRYGETLAFHGVERYAARVHYYENVSGIWERDSTGTFRTIGINPVRTNFDTEALILEFAERFSLEQLVSAAAILQHVVPVHTAIEENALKVVPALDGDKARLALVDLYPGGVGIINAMQRSTWLAPALFDQVVTWLSSLKDTAATPEVLKSPIFRTRNIDRLDIRGTARVFTAAAMQAR